MFPGGRGKKRRGGGRGQRGHGEKGTAVHACMVLVTEGEGSSGSCFSLIRTVIRKWLNLDCFDLVQISTASTKAAEDSRSPSRMRVNLRKTQATTRRSVPETLWQPR
jgi:hypothetical protein